MFCPECNERVRDGAKYCPRCGSPLLDQTSSMPQFTTPNVLADENTVAKQNRWAMPLAVLFASCTALFVAVYAVLAISKGSVQGSPNMDGATLFYEGTQFIEGQNGIAQMRVRVPKGYGDATIVDENDNMVAVVRESDMEDSGDGYLWATVPVSVDTTKAGKKSYRLSQSQEDDAGSKEEADDKDEPVTKEDDDDSKGDSVPVIVDIIPTEPVPIVEENWILADACDWVDKTYGSGGTGARVAKALAKHLAKDKRVSAAQAYGSAVMFTNTEGVLHCVSLAPLTGGLLGSAEADEHTYAESDPAIDAFTDYKKGEVIDEGLGITAGNTMTNGDVLLLEPTPELMDKTTTTKVRESCKSYAASMDGSLDAKAGEDALPAILAGSMNESGVVVLRAHGIEAKESGISLLQMYSDIKDTHNTWDGINTRLTDYIQMLEGESSQEFWSSFLGEPGNSDVWESAVTARTTGTKGSWDIGVSITTNLIRQYYQDQEFEQSILWLSSCGSLTDTTFATFALNHGVQIVKGYEGVVSEEVDAQSLCDMLDGLTSDSGEEWRNQSVAEVIEETEDSDQDDAYTNGNLDVFAQGTGTLEGRVVTKEGDALEGIQVEAWRYYGMTFSSCGTTTTDDEGTFSLDELPCGRYVLEAGDSSKKTMATIVLDEESIDGGDLELNTKPKVSVEDNDEDEDEDEGEQKDEGKDEDDQEAADDDGDSSADKHVEAAADVGTTNWGVTADAEYYYISISSVYHYDNDSYDMPFIVRVSRKDTDSKKVIWNGEERGRVNTMVLNGNRLYALNSGESRGQIISMNVDGTDAKTILEGSELAGIYSNGRFAIAHNRLLYFSSSGQGWKLCSCELDSSKERVLCEGSVESSASLSALSILSVTEKNVYFSMPYGETLGSEGVALCSMTLNGKGSYEKLFECPRSTGFQVYDNRIYTVEDGAFVSYSLSGNEKTEMASLPSNIEIGNIWNMNGEYAFIFGHSASYSDYGIWRINMGDGKTVLVSEDLNDVTINIVDENIIAIDLGGEVEFWDADLRVIKKLNT